MCTDLDGCCVHVDSDGCSLQCVVCTRARMDVHVHCIHCTARLAQKSIDLGLQSSCTLQFIYFGIINVQFRVQRSLNLDWTL